MSQPNEHLRCPICLKLGQLHYEHGLYACRYCDQSWPLGRLDEFRKAFEAGRKYQRGMNEACCDPVVDVRNSLEPGEKSVDGRIVKGE